MRLAVLSQASPQNDENFAEHNLRVFTDSAQLVGADVIHIPLDWDEFSPEDVLFGRSFTGPGLFVGYINDNAYYERLYAAAAEAGLNLLNGPDVSARAMEFEQFYPLIADITPRSRIVEAATPLEDVVSELGWPIFVKGGIKSDKENGWKACVVESLEELELRRQWFSKRPITARGKMVARQVAPLRRSGAIVGGFPEAREYRVFLYDGGVLGLGYYWGSTDPFGDLSEADLAEVHRLSMLAAGRIGCPLMAVDVGQIEDGSWIVIETGDLQYSGVSQMPHLVFWNELMCRLGAS